MRYIFVSFALLAWPGLVLAASSSDNYMVMEHVADAAGNTYAGATMNLLDAAGEPAKGLIYGTDYAVQAGYFCESFVAQPTPTAAPTPVPTGTPVVYSDAQKRLRVLRSQINPALGERARIQWYQFDNSPVTLTIYTMLGEEVITLVRNGSYAQDQLHSVYWDGHNSAGSECASGIYIVYMSAGEYKAYSQVAIIK